MVDIEPAAEQRISLRGLVEPSLLIVALPILHILCASLFLSGYCMGFGAGISAFVSPTDLFSVSIGQLVPAYILAGVSLLFSTAARSGETISAKSRERKRREIRVFTCAFLFTYAVFPLIYFAWEYFHRQYPLPIIMLAFPMMALLLGGVIINGIGRLSRFEFLAIMSVAVLMICLTMFGAQKGHSARYSKYADTVRQSASCNRYVIIRQFSDIYLAVAPNGSKLFIDKECKARFLIPPVSSS